MSYRTDLAYALRLRHLDEATIGDIVAEVDAHERDHGDPEAFFGPAETYAAQFPPRPRRHRHLVATYVGVALAIGYLVVMFGLAAADVLELPRLVLLPAAALIGLAMVVDVVLLRTRRIRPPATRPPATP